MLDKELSSATKPPVKLEDFHHPTFSEVDARGDDDNLPTAHLLNDDCLDMILSYFDLVELFQLSSVCRRWYNLCIYKISCSKYFSTETFKNYNDDTQQRDRSPAPASLRAVMSVLSLTHGNLESLSLSAVVGLNAEILSTIGDLLPNLKELEFCFELELDEALFQIIGERFVTNLECLMLQSWHADNIKCKWLLKDARNLRFLNITGYNDDDNPNQLCLTDFISTDNPLMCIRFQRFTHLHPDSMTFIFKNFAATLEYIDLSYTNLQGLANCSISLPELVNMKVFIAPIQMYDFPISANRPPFDEIKCTHQFVSVLKLMPNLRVLDLTYNLHLTSNRVDIVDILANHCPLLEQLFLGCCWIPAEKLVNLQKLSFLKRLDVDHCKSRRGMCLNLPSYDFITSFWNIATFVIPHLKKLEYFSLTHSFWSDKQMDRTIQGHELFEFLKNAGPKFKGIFLTTAKSRDGGEPYDFVAEAVKMCKTLNRTSLMKIYLHNHMFINKNSALIMDYFDSISPPFVRVKFSGNSFSEKLNSSDVRSKYVNLPKFLM